MYDSEEYQNAVYAGAGTVAVSGDNGYEMDEDELDEEEAEVEVEEDEDDEDDDARLYATPKSVRKLSRDLRTALQARSPGRTETHGEAERALAGTSTKVAMSPSPSPSICTGSETGNEEDGAIDDIDWSSSDSDLQLSFSPTSLSVRPDKTSTDEMLVGRLKHTPVSKQSRPRTGAVGLTTSITRPTPTRPSPLPTKPTTNTPPPPQPQPPSQSPMTSPLIIHPPGFKYPPNWHEKTPSQKWSTNPNLRARELSSSPRRIRTELPSEPEYAFRDAEIRDGLWGLVSSIEDFAEKYFSKGAHDDRTTTDENEDIMVKKEWFETLRPETAKLVNCVASGGPSGLMGWHGLFVNREKMQAVVCEMIGNVLTEQVLQHEFFGGGEEGLGAVRGVQREGKDADGEFTFGFVVGGRGWG